MLQQRIIQPQILIVLRLRNLCLYYHNSTKDILVTDCSRLDVLCVAHFINMCAGQFISFSHNVKYFYHHFKKPLEKES